MIKRTLIAATALMLMTGMVFAEPVLRGDITVSGDVVTAGDMFEGAGAFAELAMFRAPSPGTAGVVSRADVDAAAKRIGMDGFNLLDKAGVRVSRSATLVDETMLVGLIENDLARRGILGAGVSTRTMFDAPVNPVNAAATDAPATLAALRYLPGSQRFSAQFTFAGVPDTLDISGSIDLMVDVPHLAVSVSAGTILTPEHIVMSAIPLRLAETSGYADVADLVGKALQRQSRAGVLLRLSDVAVPDLISRNDMVTIYYRSGPMTLTVKGQALASAADGETIQILNLMSNRVISARAVAPGAVMLSTDPLETAGL